MGHPVFARSEKVQGLDFQSGDEVPAGLFTEHRFNQMVNIRRIVDSDSGDRRIPFLIHRPGEPSRPIEPASSPSGETLPPGAETRNPFVVREGTD